MNKILHKPVLINQVVKFLNLTPGAVVVDCTVGVGGHSEAVLNQINPTGTLYAIDADNRNLEAAKKQLKSFKNVNFIRTNFETLEDVGKNILEREGKINAVLFDLGLSSIHVDVPERGFSFLRDGPLDMRFDTEQELTAAKIVNSYPIDSLISILKIYGEERFYHRIAGEIVRRRRVKKFATTTELADFIATIVPRRGKINPATRVFQALRIATNREVEVLQTGLAAAVKILSAGGRVVVISYHSLEDRIVKHFFKAMAANEIIKILTKKPVRPDSREVLENKRSRSAKLRAAEKN